MSGTQVTSSAEDGVRLKPDATAPDACAVWIEVEGRQRYLFETDKLREMLGASRQIANTVAQADEDFKAFNVFQAVSGEIGVWAPRTARVALVQAAWQFGKWLDDEGMAFVMAYLDTSSRHFKVAAPDPAKGDLKKQVIQPLKRAAAAAKESRSHVDASPHCALFVPCRIHGWEYATTWNPKQAQEHRRQLVGTRATRKLNAWESVKEKFYQNQLKTPVEKKLEQRRANRPITFTDLADDQDGSDGDDQFVAFICADGDGMGTVLQKIDWNGDWNDGLKPGDRNRDFALQLDQIQQRAFQEALKLVVVEALGDIDVRDKDGKCVVKLPMLPQLMGGDDLWVVIRRDLALPFARAFADQFSALTASEAPEFRTVRNALKSTDVNSLSMSLGIAFAKAGHPAHAMIAAAESLLKSAKKLRKDELEGRPKTNEGCLDWHWIASSMSEDVADARKAGLAYAEQVGGERLEFHLTTRPWTLSQTAEALKARKQFETIARRKREQLESILREGYDVSRLAWEGWWKGLDAKERKTIRELKAELHKLVPLEAPQKHDITGFYWPWSAAFDVEGKKRITTPFLDLLALADPMADKSQPKTKAVAP